MTEPTLPLDAGAVPAAGDAAAAAAATDAVAAGAPRPRRRRGRIAILIILAAILGIFLLFTGWYLATRKPVSELPVIPPIAVAVVPTYQTSVYGAMASTGVAVDSSGDRIYATQTSGELIVKIFDGKGNQVGVIRPPESTGTDHVPVYVAVDPSNGDVYVSDRPAGAIYVYDRDGVYRRTFDPGPELTNWQPLGMGFDGKGGFFVTDVSGPYHRVHQFGSDGKLVQSIGEAGMFNFPNGVAVDANGLIYVTDSNNGRVVIFTPDGKQRAVIPRGPREGDLGLPRGIAIDDEGRVYVVDTSAHTVQIYKTLAEGERAPTYVGSFGVQGSQDGAFEFPSSVATDARGRVYVSDLANNRVQVWTY